MIPTNPLPSDLPPNTRVSKPLRRYGLRDWFASPRGIAFLTMGLFAFLGAWFGAIVYFACWLAERVFTVRSLVIALHVGAFVLIGSVTGAIKHLDSEAPPELRRPLDQHVLPSFLAWTALLMMSSGFWLFVLR
jgi:hypothetical protein